jgi:hypothetical protein
VRLRKKNTPNAVKPIVKRTTARPKVKNTQRHLSSVISLSCGKLVLKRVRNMAVVLYAVVAGKTN